MCHILLHVIASPAMTSHCKNVRCMEGQRASSCSFTDWHGLKMARQSDECPTSSWSQIEVRTPTSAASEPVRPNLCFPLCTCNHFPLSFILSPIFLLNAMSTFRAAISTTARSAVATRARHFHASPRASRTVVEKVSEVADKVRRALSYAVQG